MRQTEIDVKRGFTTTRMTTGSTGAKGEKERGAGLLGKNPYSQADSIIRHNETVVAILSVDNLDSKRTHDTDGKEFYIVISRHKITEKYIIKVMNK